MYSGQNETVFVFETRQNYVDHVFSRSFCPLCRTHENAIRKWGKIKSIVWYGGLCRAYGVKYNAAGDQNEIPKAARSQRMEIPNALNWSLLIDYRLHRYPPNQFERCGSHENTSSSTRSLNSLWNLFFANFDFDQVRVIKQIHNIFFKKRNWEIIRVFFSVQNLEIFPNKFFLGEHFFWYLVLVLFLNDCDRVFSSRYSSNKVFQHKKRCGFKCVCFRFITNQSFSYDKFVLIDWNWISKSDS